MLSAYMMLNYILGVAFFGIAIWVMERLGSITIGFVRLGEKTGNYPRSKRRFAVLGWILCVLWLVGGQFLINRFPEIAGFIWGPQIGFWLGLMFAHLLLSDSLKPSGIRRRRRG